MVEFYPSKVVVTSSSLVSRSIKVTEIYVSYIILEKIKFKYNFFSLKASLVIVNGKEGYMDLNRRFWSKDVIEKMSLNEKNVLYNHFIGKSKYSGIKVLSGD